MHNRIVNSDAFFVLLQNYATPRKSNLYITGLLNCPKSGKNARIVMVEGIVAGQTFDLISLENLSYVVYGIN